VVRTLRARRSAFFFSAGFIYFEVIVDI